MYTGRYLVFAHTSRAASLLDRRCLCVNAVPRNTLLSSLVHTTLVLLWSLGLLWSDTYVLIILSNNYFGCENVHDTLTSFTCLYNKIVHHGLTSAHGRSSNTSPIKRSIKDRHSYCFKASYFYEASKAPYLVRLNF
jgi:hypothetical protein